MKRPYVRLQLPDKRSVGLYPGDLISRGPTAALHIPDARVSEAHAMISFRNNKLWMLGLRGRIAEDGRHPSPEIELRPGLTIKLGPALRVYVESVVIPRKVLAMRIGARTVALQSRIYSITTEPQLEVVPNNQPDASAQVWCAEGLWFFHPRGAPAVELAAGQTVEVDGVHIIEQSPEGIEETRFDGRDPLMERERGLQLTLNGDLVTIQGGERPLDIAGKPAEVIVELAAYNDIPVHWQLIARAIWKDTEDKALLQGRWSQATRVIRLRLEEHGVRPDLVSKKGKGNWQLVLTPNDQLIDNG